MFENYIYDAPNVEIETKYINNQIVLVVLTLTLLSFIISNEKRIRTGEKIHL